MKTTTKNMPCVFLASALAAAVVLPVAGGAESSSARGAPHRQEKTSGQRALDISWWSVDGGGGTSAGGSFVLLAAAGQPDTGLANACGQVLDGGLWAASVNLRPLFCDSFESGSAGSWSNVNPEKHTTPGSHAHGGE